MAKVEGPLFSVWAQGSIGRSTIYFKPRHIADNTYQFAVQKCKGKLTRYSKNKIYGPEGKGALVATYWKIWSLKARQWQLIRKLENLYVPPEV